MLARVPAYPYQPAMSPAVRLALTHIRQGLAQLVREGRGSVIDLARIAAGPGEYEQLRDVLGDGEVFATVATDGRAVVRETGIAGVWWIERDRGEDTPAARLIEIGYVPCVLVAHKDDVDSGLRQLSTRLAGG